MVHRVDMNTTTTTPTTTTDPKVETIERMYAAFGRGDLDAILAEVADDVDWGSEATSASVPWHGRNKGKDGVAAFIAALGGSAEMAEFTPLSMTWNDTDVMVVIRSTMTARATGRSVTTNLYHWWRFGDDAKIVLYRGSHDSELLASMFA